VSRLLNSLHLPLSPNPTAETRTDSPTAGSLPRQNPSTGINHCGERSCPIPPVDNKNFCRSHFWMDFSEGIEHSEIGGSLSNITAKAFGVIA
jgi:hypothetical protein